MNEHISYEYLKWLREKEVGVTKEAIELTLEIEDSGNIKKKEDREKDTQIERGFVIVDHDIYGGDNNG